MLGANHTQGGPSLLLIELGLTLITVALAFCCPGAGSKLFSRLERPLGELASKRALCVFLVGVTACALRLLLLPVSPIPQPYIHDDFSFLLAADTFAHGRLTNPPHPLWSHFESFHITVRPTYMSMYFPAQGMIMAAGQILAGHPWYGIWATSGLMCAALCWMLQGWMPPGWALLGSMLAILRLSLFSYWIDTYTGAGLVAALGGALVLGALPRIQKHFQRRDYFWMALGMAILATSRPYEGLLVSLAAVATLVWSFCKRPHPPTSILIRRAAPAVVLLVATFAFMGYYDYRVFGNPFTPPYKINRETYAVVPHFLWQAPRPIASYRHAILCDFYSGSAVGSELKYFQDETRSVVGLFEISAGKILSASLFYLGFALAPPLLVLPWALRDRRIRTLVLTTVVVVIGLGAETFFIEHYLAPATVLVYALLLQCMRHLRVWRPSGLFLVRATPLLCFALAALRTFAGPLHIELGAERSILYSWSGGRPVGLERAAVAAELESLPGPQLAIVPYSPQHMLNDWVYNGADIDKSKVVWARQMDPASDRQLLNYYRNRKAWLVEPDCNPPRISPYPAPSLSGTRAARTLEAVPVNLKGKKR